MPIHVSTHVTASGDVTASYTSTGSFGRVDATKFYGDGSGITNLPNAAINTYNTSGDDRIITSVNGSTVQGEENLTFDGTTLNIDGNVSASGDITANNYIIKSTVTQVTTSFSDGNTIFGNSMDDTHRFTGSIDVSGSITSFGLGIISSSAQIASDISGSLSKAHLAAKVPNIVSASVLSSGAQGTITLTTNGVGNNVDSGLQVGDSPSFTGLTVSALTNSKLLGVNGSGVVGEKNLIDFVGGASNRISVADDGDGTITLSTPQDLDTSADVTFDSITLDDLTASKLAGTDGNKKLVSINLDDFVTGASNQISVADDGDGTITLSTPQDLHTSATPTFAGLTIDGNISASGDITANNYIIKNQVTEMTTSFSQGNTIFGDTMDDRHEFTGSVFITGSLDVTQTGSFGRIEATSISASLIEVDANTIKIGGQTINEADATVLNATSGTNTGDITLAGTPNYITIANQVLTRNTIDIGDDTNLVGGTGITLTGDTLTTTDSEIVHDSLSGFEANEHIDHSNVSISTGTGLTGGGDITSTRTLTVDFTDTDLQSAISGSWRGLISGSAGKISGSLISTGSFGRLETAGDVEIGGTLTANTIISNVISQSVAFATGSTIFGDNVADTHKFTGSLSISGSINVTDGGKGAVTASFFKGDGSALTGLTAAAISSYTNAGDNRVMTSVNSSTANAEANLTFDGTDFKIATGGDLYVDQIRRMTDSSTTTKINLLDEEIKLFANHSSNEVVNIKSGIFNVTGNVTASGDISGSATSTGSFAHVHIPDGTSGLGIGNDSDLLLYHNGNHSYIKDNGTGNLYVQGGTQTFQNAAANKTMMVLNASNSVDLYYNNSKKFETTNTGVNVTGKLYASSHITGSNISASGNLYGTNLYGTIATATQNSITTATGLTSVGTIGTGTWEGTTIAVAQGGTGATTLNDLITLGTHSTGNYVGTLTGGTGITSTGATSGEGIAHSISVDASQTQITSIGTIGTGTWQGTSISTTYTDAKVTSIVAGNGIDVSGATGDVTIDVEAATHTNAGMIEIATTGETTTGTDTTRAVSPDGLKDGYQGSANVTTLGTITTGVWNGTSIGTSHTDAKVTSIVAGDGIDVSGGTGDVTVTAEAASDSNPGVVELATTGETTTGTDATRAVTPDGLKDGYQGSTNVTTLGTIGTGTWNGTVITSAYLDSDTAHLTTDQTFTGNKTFSNAITGSNYSGSAASTGSFGRVEATTGKFTNGLTALSEFSMEVAEYISHFEDSDTYVRFQNNTLDLGSGGAIFRIQNNKISGSSTSTGSFGKIELNDDTHLNVNNYAISGSTISTGSFGRMQAHTISGNSNLIIDADNLKVDDTGKIAPTGDLSGSAASTGSFGYLNIPGDAVIGGKITAQEFHTELTTTTILYDSGSTKFGDTLDDTHEITGSLRVTGSGANVFSVKSKTGANPLFTVDNDGGNNMVAINTIPTEGMLDIRSTSQDRYVLAIINAAGTQVGGFYNASDRNILQLKQSGGTVGVNLDPLGSGGSYFLSNVGIGTTSPVGKLDVVGTQTLHLTHTTTDDTNKNPVITSYQYDSGTETEGFVMMQAFSNSSTNRIDLGGGNSQHNAVEEIRFHTAANHNTRTGTQRMVIDASGNVGIGTDSPDQLLHLNTTNGAEMVLQRTAGSTSGLLGGIHFGNADVDDYLSSIYSYQDGATDSAYLSFHTEVTGGSKAEKMRITSTGNVGIGQDTPTSKLHVQSGDGVNSTNFVGQFLNMDSTNGQSNGVSIRAGNGSSDSSFKVNNRDDSSLFLVRGDGKIGIGTNNPSTLMHIFEDASGLDAGLLVECTANNASAYLDLRSAADRDTAVMFREGSTLKAQIFHDASADSLILTDGANSNTLYIIGTSIGIGQASPSHKLDVSGTGRFTGLLTTAAITAAGNITANGNIVGDNATNISGVNNITTLGNISGSSTSTGSFGSLYVGGTTTIQESVLSATARNNADDLVVKGASSDGVGISILGHDSYYKNLNFGGTNSNRDALISYSGTSDNLMSIGTTRSGGKLRIFTGNGDESFRISGGTNGVISGSSTSTGSFGHLKVNGGNFTSASLASAIASAGSSGVTVSNNANNRVLTGDGSNANAEANLIFDGTKLGIGATSIDSESLFHLKGNEPNIFFEDTNDNQDWRIYATSVFSFYDVTNSREMLRLGTVEAVFNEGGADLDFRIESDANTHAFFLQGSSGNIGIGDTDPGSKLVVVGTGDNARFGSTSDGVVLAHTSGVGYIQGTDTGGSAYNALGFKTSANYAMYIDTSERVIIGHTAAITSVGNTMNLQINNASNNNNGVSINSWGTNGAHQGSIRFNHSKSGTAGSHTALANTDAIGSIYWQGSDGTDFANSSARIYVDVDGTVAANRVPARITFATAEGAADNDILPKMTIRADGKVGIGETSPDAPLHVKGGTANTAKFQSNSGATNLTFTDASDNLVGQLEFSTSTSQLVTRNSSTLKLGSNNVGTIFITDADNVGIGTASPDGKLHVHTATAGSITPRTDADDLIVENSAHGGISILTPDDQFSNLVFGSPSDIRGAVLDYSHSTKVLNIGSDVASGQVAIKIAAGTEAVRIDASGNVGIGDTTPSYKLEVAGTLGVSGDVTLTGTNSLMVSDGGEGSPRYSFTSDTNTGIFRPSNDALGFTTGGTERLNISDTGVHTINSSGDMLHLKSVTGDHSPQIKFTRNATSYSWYMGMHQSSGLSDFFLRNGAGAVVLSATTAGKVGIGTNIPEKALHVVGDIKAIGDIWATGDVIANRLVVSSSVSHITSSFSSGSTIFGDTQDDLHHFTGSIAVTGSSLTVSNPGADIKVSGGDNVSMTIESTNAARNNSLHFKNTADNKHFEFKQNSFDPGSGTNQLELLSTDTADIMVVNQDGNIGFGTTSPSSKLEVNGTAKAQAFVEQSSMRYKENIETLESPLEKISKLRGVSYNLIENKEPSIGMIAEEVNEIFPELVSKDDSGEVQSMSYTRMTAVLLEAVKELTEEVKELKKSNIYNKYKEEK